MSIPLHKEQYNPFGQRAETAAKYREAIFGCYDISYIGMSVSQIARHFGVSPSGLGNQLRNHFPDMYEEREILRKRLGYSSYTNKSAQAASAEKYSNAVQLLDTTALTLREVALKCGVSLSGLRQHVIYYHKHIAEKRYLARVLAAEREVRIGEKNGGNQVKGPKKETVEKYAEALTLYQTTSLTMVDIAHRTGVTIGGLRNYLTKWHQSDMIARRGVGPLLSDEERFLIDNKELTLKTKRYSPSAAERYAPAIEMILDGAALPEACRACGFPSTDNLRYYLREHYPNLLKKGMEAETVLLPEGTRCPKESWDLFKDAVEAYTTTDEPLNAIAGRFGLRPTSLSAFLRRTFPKAVADRRASAEQKREMNKAEYKKKKRTVQKREEEFREAKEAKYASAIAVYSEGTRSAQDVAAEFGFSVTAFRSYLRAHHPDLVTHRREKYAERVALARIQRASAQKSEQAERALHKAQRSYQEIPKYEPAVAEYSMGMISISALAQKYDLSHVGLRDYIGTRYPDLIAFRGKMVREELDRKYGSAVKEVLSSTDSLEKIARRHGLSRNGLRNYLVQYKPELYAHHCELLTNKNSTNE